MAGLTFDDLPTVGQSGAGGLSFDDLPDAKASAQPQQSAGLTFDDLPDAKEDKLGAMGSSWGMMTPEEQKAWSAERETKLADFARVQDTTATGLRQEAASPKADNSDPLFNYFSQALDTARVKDADQFEQGAQKSRDELRSIQKGTADPVRKTATRSAVENLVRGVGADVGAGLVETIGIAAGYATRAVSGDKIDPADNALYKVGQSIREYVEKRFPGDERRQDELAQQLARGAGQVAALYGPNAALRIVGAGTKTMVGVSTATGAGMEGSSLFNEATAAMREQEKKASSKRQTAARGPVDPITEQDRFINFMGGIGLGATEAIPLATDFAGSMRGWRRVLAKGAEQGLEEGAQEAGQTMGENILAQNTFDPERRTMEGVGNAIAVGGILGILGGAGSEAITEMVRPKSEFEEALDLDTPAGAAPEAAGGLPTPEGLVPAQDAPPPPPAPVSSPEPQSGYERLHGETGASASRPTPKVGDFVQWTSGGADQFKSPQRVVWVSDDGSYVRVEGSMTGLPAGETTVVGPVPPSTATSTVLEELTQREGGKKSPLGKADVKAEDAASFYGKGATPYPKTGDGYGDSPAPSATSTVLDEISKREGGKKSPLGKGLSEITAGQKGGQAAVDRVAGTVAAVPVGEPVKITTPDSSAEIEARPVLVELDTLKPASGKLQPRDRGRVEMVQEAKERAVRLDPARLMPDRVSDAGAPIVTADGTVISGNGRVLSIAEVYNSPALKAQANAYKAALPAEAQGMKKPVLVMQSQLSGLDAERFAQQSNRPRIATMSATEQANTDAAVMGDILDLYQGGDFESAPNAPFLKAFATNVVASSERNSFSKDGQLSAEGMRRMQGAILARAYGETGLLSRMLESTDDNVRAIVGALQDAAPQMAALRKAVQAGQVMEGLDPLPDISAAVSLVSDMRKKRLSPAKFFRQMDAFTEVNPDVAGWVLSLYNPADPKTGAEAGEHALSRPQMAAVFKAFANEAMQHKTGGFFDDETTRSAILSAVGRNAAGAVVGEAPGNGPSDGSSGSANGQAPVGGRGPQASLSDAQAPASSGTEQGEVEPRARREAFKRLKSGADYEVPLDTISTIYEAVADDIGMVPADTHFGVVERIENSSDPKAKVGEEVVKVYIRLANGKLGTRKYLRNFITKAGAFYDPDVNALVFVRLGQVPRLGREGAAFAKSLRGELRHELLHLLRRKGVLTGAQWNDLVRHARRLQVLRYAQSSFTQLTGKPLPANPEQRTLETLYTLLYRSNDNTDKEIEENLDQEFVAHALELAYHGKLNEKEAAPLQGLIDKMELRMYGRGATAAPVNGRPSASLSPNSRPPLDMSPEARKARAEEMGFDTSFVAYRGMKGEYSDSVAGSLDYQFFARDPSVASEYAENGVVVPVWLRLGRGLTINARGQPFYGIDPRSLPLDIHRTAREIADEIAKKSRSQPTIDAEVLARAAKASGYESLTIRNVIDNFDLNNEKRSTIHVVFSPSNIRSTSAAFDPKEGTSTKLLASLAPSSAPSLDPDAAGPLRKARDSALEFLQDAQLRVRRLVERADEPLPDDADPYMAMTLYHGRLGGRAEAATEKAKVILQGTNAIAKATNSPLENVKRLIDLYLVAKHAPERNAVHGDGSAGLTNAEATAALARVSALPQGADIIRVAGLVQEMNRQTLQTLLDGKVISQETFDLLSATYANHVPLNRILPEGDEEIGAILAGGGFDVRGTGLKRAQGSKLPIAPILENVLLNHEQAIVRAEKNTVDLATLAFVRRFEDDLKGQITILGGKKPARTIDAAERGIRDQITALKKMLPKDDRPHHMDRMPATSINDPRVLELREDGERVLIRFRDPKLAAAFKATNSEKMPRVLYPLMVYTRVMSQLATRFNPEFTAPNKIRDIQETAIYIAAQKELGAKGAAKFLLREMKGENYKAILDWMMGRDTPGARLYQEMIDEGGTTGGLALSSRDRVKESIAEIEKLVTASPANLRKLLKSTANAFDHLNKVFEDSTRLSAYRSAKGRGLTKKRAAVHAKEASINFNRMGTAGPVINGLWMFSNASIQGTTKMVRAMKNPKVAGVVVLSMAAAVTALGEWNDQWDEKWREKVTKWDRLNSLVVVLPSTTANQFNYVVIPVSWGLKPILNLANYAYDAEQGIEWAWGDFLRDMTTATLEAANPVGGTTLTQALVPTALDLPVDIASNTSWSGSKIKPDPQRGVPEDVRYFSSLKDKTSGQVSIAATEALVDSTGIAVSPADVNYAFEQTVGGVGRSAGRVLTTAQAVIEGKVPDKDQFPFLARFYRRREGEEIGAGQSLGTETREVRRIVDQQGRERVRRKYQIEGIFEEIKKLPKDEIKQRIAAEVKKDPAVFDIFKGLIESEAKGLTGLDKQITLLGVENGERARYYFDRLKEASPDERRSIVEDGVKKGLISRGVIEQIGVLNQLERLSPDQRRQVRTLASENGLRLPPE
jgi:hypothetical protein